ncbi:MAG: hypothetical protein ACE5OY_04495 [Candidatus Bathyarchaeia archaeon]
MSQQGELESFLMLFADELKKGYSPEMSFQVATRRYDGLLSDKLQKAHSRLVNGEPLEKTFQRLAHHLSEEGSSIALKVVEHFCMRDARSAGYNIAHFVRMLRQNRELQEEMKRMLESFGFRVRVITLACTAASAFIASLSPLLRMLTFGIRYPYEANWSVAIFLFLSSVIASYYAGRTVAARKALSNVLLSSITYVVTLLCSLALFRTVF